MAMVKEYSSCKTDTECSSRQYCYIVSGDGLCVNYTQCGWYNRIDTENARSSAQCGPCLPGYTSERLGTGEMAPLCSKIPTTEKPYPEVDTLSSVVIIFVAMGVLAFIMVTMVLLIRFTRRYKSQNNNREHWGEITNSGPSAPPAEHSPFIGTRMIPAACNNNKCLLMDKNKLVNANPFQVPDWVLRDPNYEYEVSNEHLNNSDRSNGSGQVVPVARNSNTWPPNRHSIQQPDGSNYGVEQMDNTMNNALVHMNHPSTSNTRGNNNNNNQNGDHNSESTSGSDGQNNSERGRANILISQKIVMNVNMLNSDC